MPDPQTPTERADDAGREAATYQEQVLREARDAEMRERAPDQWERLEKARQDRERLPEQQQQENQFVPVEATPIPTSHPLNIFDNPGAGLVFVIIFASRFAGRVEEVSRWFGDASDDQRIRFVEKNIWRNVDDPVYALATAIDLTAKVPAAKIDEIRLWLETAPNEHRVVFFERWLHNAGVAHS